MFMDTSYKITCQTCSQLEPMKIKHPTDLMACIELMKKLIENGNFEKESSNFELMNPKTPDGFWQDDIMCYSIRCKECGQIYVCVCDTYHGNGHFAKTNFFI